MAVASLVGDAAETYDLTNIGTLFAFAIVCAVCSYFGSPNRNAAAIPCALRVGRCAPRDCCVPVCDGRPAAPGMGAFCRVAHPRCPCSRALRVSPLASALEWGFRATTEFLAVGMAHDWIAVRGARVHNSRTSTLTSARSACRNHGAFGLGKVIAGFRHHLCGGQRRYVESLSAYARQFLEQMEKPDVDLIEGLSPAISIEQKTTGSNPRSTVGTVTEIYDYLRLRFANIGVPSCYRCAARSRRNRSSASSTSSCSIRRTRASTCLRRSWGERGVQEGPAALRQRGFTKARIDGQFRSLEEGHQTRSPEEPYDRDGRRSVDRPVGHRAPFVQLPRARAELADDIVIINTYEGGDQLFSRRLACVTCGISMPEMTPRAFSFNSPHGACPIARAWRDV